LIDFKIETILASKNLANSRFYKKGEYFTACQNYTKYRLFLRAKYKTLDINSPFLEGVDFFCDSKKRPR